MQPAVGVPLESRQGWHRNLEAAIQHHSTTLAKQPAISVVEANGKVQVQANYSKDGGRGEGEREREREREFPLLGARATKLLWLDTLLGLLTN